MTPAEFRKFCGEPITVNQEWLDTQVNKSVEWIIEDCKKSFSSCIKLRTPLGLWGSIAVPSNLSKNKESYVITRICTIIKDFLQKAYPEKLFDTTVGERCFCGSLGFIAYHFYINECDNVCSNKFDVCSTNSVNKTNKWWANLKRLFSHF